MEKVYFEEINGKKIFCYFSEPESAQKKIVIMSHGFRGANPGPARQFVDFQRLLNKEGFSVLRFDQPNSGNSDGDYLDVSYKEWVDTTTYFAKKYLDLGYKVALMGQSMGATVTIVATARPELKNKIPCILLWVPGVNEGDFNGDLEEVFEEGGQKYKGRFWKEAQDEDSFKCLEEYAGGIHLVYGETDRYVGKDLRERVMAAVEKKGEPYMVLKGQDHSPWKFDLVQKVYKEEIALLQKYF
jgi:dienelactone hydrolase